jgi:hypothetical protein
MRLAGWHAPPCREVIGTRNVAGQALAFSGSKRRVRANEDPPRLTAGSPAKRFMTKLTSSSWSRPTSDDPYGACITKSRGFEGSRKTSKGCEVETSTARFELNRLAPLLIWVDHEMARLINSPRVRRY